jgi:hypothetical protein
VPAHLTAASRIIAFDPQPPLAGVRRPHAPLSGRTFLQECGVRFENTLELVKYFAALRRARRCEVLRDANVALSEALD